MCFGVEFFDFFVSVFGFVGELVEIVVCCIDCEIDGGDLGGGNGNGCWEYIGCFCCNVYCGV